MPQGPMIHSKVDHKHIVNFIFKVSLYLSYGSLRLSQKILRILTFNHIPPQMDITALSSFPPRSPVFFIPYM